MRSCQQNDIGVVWVVEVDCHVNAEWNGKQQLREADARRLLYTGELLTSHF